MIMVRSPTLPSCSVEFLLLEVRRDFLRGRPKQIHRPPLLSLLLRGQWASINWPRPIVSEIDRHRSAGCLINARMVEHMRMPLHGAMRFAASMLRFQVAIPDANCCTAILTAIRMPRT
jgi:hypothetical protein